MKEDEGTLRYMSPLVKQDLAKLEKDGECRRVALHALKQFVEKLEPSSVPRFLAQVSESKGTKGSRSYAISLYEEVARVHGKLIIPQIGRVMTTMTRSLSANGSSLQLHQACAKVALALVRYSIDSDSSGAEAEEILKQVSRPLVGLLTGKPEQVAAGAATCMQALVESEKWKLAPPDLVSEVCHRTTTALGDKSTRTVAHMELARSLATMNPGTLNVYGACLIHAAEEVLSSCTYSWQLRKCAAKMVQIVFGIVDRETLALEFHALTQILENCKHDKMPHVRTAVCEALQTAKMILTGELIEDEDDEDHMGSVSFNPTNETPQLRNWNSNKYSPSSQATYNLSSYTPPPVAGDSVSSDPFSTPLSGSTGRMKRSLLFPSKADNHSLTAVQVPAARFTVNHDPTSVKENVRPSVLGGSAPDSRGGLSVHYDQAPALHRKPVDDIDIAGVQQNDKELVDEKDFTSKIVFQDHPKGKVKPRFSPLEEEITRSFGEAEGDLMEEDEEILSRGSAELGYYTKNEASTRGQSRLAIAKGQVWQESQTPESMGDNECFQSSSISYRGPESGHSDANNFALPGKTGYSRNNVGKKVVDVWEKIQTSQLNSLQGQLVGKPNVHDLNAGISHAQYMKLANLSNNPEDSFSALKPRVLITTADFLPFTTPRRLVLSLQSQLSSPGEEVNNEDEIRRSDGSVGLRTEFNEDALRRIVDGTGKRIEFDADMDVDSSSDSGWSVRDNPIASDESATDESSEEEMEEEHIEILETLIRPTKVQIVTGIAPGKQLVSPQVESLDALDHTKFLASEEWGTLSVEGTTPCHLSPKLLGTPDANLACASCSTESQRRRSAQKAEEWDLGLDINRAADDQSIGIRKGMLFEQVETLSDISHGSKAFTSDSIDEPLWATEGEPGWCTSLVRSAKNSCSRISSVAEAVLGGSLCVIIAVPLTMLLARVLLSPQDSFLVPT